jgi:hypothetical protein
MMRRPTNIKLLSYFAYPYAGNTKSALKKEANLKTKIFRTELEHLRMWWQLG